MASPSPRLYLNIDIPQPEERHLTSFTLTFADVMWGDVMEYKEECHSISREVFRDPLKSSTFQ